MMHSLNRNRPALPLLRIDSGSLFVVLHATTFDSLDESIFQRFVNRNPFVGVRMHHAQQQVFDRWFGKVGEEGPASRSFGAGD